MTLQAFLDKHRLPDSYRDTAVHFFDPLAEKLIAKQRQNPDQTLFVGVNGCQGSGKTTLADYLAFQFEQSGLSVCAISIDDFYLTQAERQSVSESVHPLFLTRGVPGTHDMLMAQQILKSLREKSIVKIPRYNKATDERHPDSAWQMVTAPLNIVILEGWCVAVPSQNDDDLYESVNDLEHQRDPEGIWRKHSNNLLKTDYATVWDLLDYTIMLKAPSFDHVYRWRLEQEEKLREKIARNGGDDSGIMSSEQIHDFIAYYERLTRHALEVLPQKCDCVFELGSSRQVGTAFL